MHETVLPFLPELLEPVLGLFALPASILGLTLCVVQAGLNICETAQSAEMTIKAHRSIAFIFGTTRSSSAFIFAICASNSFPTSSLPL